VREKWGERRWESEWEWESLAYLQKFIHPSIYHVFDVAKIWYKMDIGRDQLQPYFKQRSYRGI
jgi:hypothetical protein